MLIHYLLLAVAVALFCVGVIGRRSGYVLGTELLAFATFLVFWMVAMSVVPARAPLGIAVPVVLALGCVVVAVVIEMGASATPLEAGTMTVAEQRREARGEDSARLAVAGFFWLALFGLAVVAFAPYLFI